MASGESEACLLSIVNPISTVKIIRGALVRFSTRSACEFTNRTTRNLLGQSLTEPLPGEPLEDVVHGNHFWFAWVVFKPGMVVYARAPNN